MIFNAFPCHRRGVVRSHEMRLFGHYGRSPTAAPHKFCWVADAIPYYCRISAVDVELMRMASHINAPSLIKHRLYDDYILPYIEWFVCFSVLTHHLCNIKRWWVSTPHLITSQIVFLFFKKLPFLRRVGAFRLMVFAL